MKKNIRTLLAFMVAILASVAGNRLFAQSGASTGFAPLDEWRKAILSGDAEVLKNFYSSNPPAEVQTNNTTAGADADTSFWLGARPKTLPIEIIRLKQKQADRESVIFKTEVQVALRDGSRETISLTEAQGWQKQGDQWRITGVERTDAPKLTQPSDMNKNIYPPEADAHAEIAEAEQRAAAAHKRVLLVFGANWCYDCHVLDAAFHRPDFASTMAGYEVVHVDLGDDEKKNGDLVKEFEIPLNKGIPALAVIDSSGKLLVSQKNGEFEDARSLTPEILLAFLNKWKPTE